MTTSIPQVKTPPATPPCSSAAQSTESPRGRREFLQHIASGTLTSAAWAGLMGAPASAQQTTAEPPRRLRVGQIGVGHAHATKLSVYRDSDDYEVVGIVEPDPQRREAAQSHRAFRDLPWLTAEQLLEQQELDVVLIETEVRDLLDWAARAIDAGKHIHLDKPAGTSLPKFRKLVEQAKQKQLMIQLGYMYRYNPGFLMLQEFVQRGWLGDIFEVHTVMSKVISPSVRQQLGEYPGGILFELGCHILDLVIKLMGRPQQIAGFRQHASPIEDQLVDNMLAVLTYDRCLATVKSSAQEVEGFARRHFVVCGTEGTFKFEPLDNPQVRVAFSDNHEHYRQGYQMVQLPKYTRYVADAADMAKVLRGEKQNDYPYEHDLLVQETLLKACGLED